jgi:hypothetical protein
MMFDEKMPGFAAVLEKIDQLQKATKLTKLTGLASCSSANQPLPRLWPVAAMERQKSDAPTIAQHA